MKLLILAVLKENNKRERCGCPLGGVWEGILKNTGITASLVHSPGNNLTWKLSLQVADPGPAVQTFSFSSNIFLTLMFSGRVWSFILTTVTSVLKMALTCFGHCLQSKERLAIYSFSIFSWALTGFARGGNWLPCSLVASWLQWNLVSMVAAPSYCHSVTLRGTAGCHLCLPHLVPGFYGTVDAWPHAKPLTTCLAWISGSYGVGQKVRLGFSGKARTHFLANPILIKASLLATCFDSLPGFHSWLLVL